MGQNTQDNVQLYLYKLKPYSAPKKILLKN